MQEKRDTAPEEKQAGPEAEQARAEASTEKAKAPQVSPAVKPGPLARAWQACCAPFANIKLPVWNIRLFSWLLLLLIVLVFLLSNWSPMRFYFFGLWFELPKALSILVLLLVGLLAGWLMRFPKQKRAE